MTREPRSRPVADGGPRMALFEPFPDPLLAYAREKRPDEDGDGSSANDGDADASEGCFLVRRLNPVFESTFGVASDQVTGRPLDDVELTGTVVTVEDHGRNEDRGEIGSHATDPDAEMRDSHAVTTAGSIFDSLRDDDGTAVRFEQGRDGETRYFHVRDVVDGTADGAGHLLFTEVTELERQRRDLAATVTRLERLASVARHDLRNPLEVADIRLEAARDTGEEVHFEKVSGSLDRIERIVRDVLAVGGGIDPIETVALEEVARDAWETVDTADATLVVSDALPTVRGDTDRLQGVFENVFRNAVEHGGRDVTVTVEPLPDGFAVTDDGPGVPAEARQRVFEAGYSNRENGSGLGLSIVRQVAREHGWHVSLASSGESSTDADAGARFEFTGVECVGNGTDQSGPCGSNELD